MKRRYLLLASALLATLGLTGCKEDKAPAQAGAAQADKVYHWKMVTAWPKNYPGLGTSAERLAERVNAMSNGRLSIKVYAAGELVPALEVFDAVSRGTAELGHGAAYYWKGKVSAAQFFTSVPFGLSTLEMNAWLNKGGGQALWDEAYAPFGIKPLAVGNSGDTADRATNMDANARFAMLEQRIATIEAELLNAPASRKTASGVQVGDVVTVDFGDGPEAFLFGSIEQAGDDFDVISPASPLGAAIAGAQAGDTVTYTMRGRSLSVQVVAIS